MKSAVEKSTTQIPGSKSGQQTDTGQVFPENPDKTRQGQDMDSAFRRRLPVKTSDLKFLSPKINAMSAAVITKILMKAQERAQGQGHSRTFHRLSRDLPIMIHD